MEKIIENLKNSPQSVFVIAEIGHNHQGNIDTCKKMFLAAKESGADAVKLQKRNNKTLYTKALFNEPYNSENSYAPTYGEHREALEFNKEQYEELIRYSKEIGIFFFSTAFDFESLDFLIDLDMPAFKIASGDLLNTPLQAKIAKQDLSAGQILTEADIAIKSPGGGLPPYELDNLIGKTLTKNLKEDDHILFEDIK